ncbi:uncharacterized protein LOC143827930 isoform X2 [Paroedura picta]|uniref:uncharacterized protein LOC143827930 isoform X2 n=1 Tax=Paroedura picta TaxID=143630 RepID=UPI004056A8CD
MLLQRKNGCVGLPSGFSHSTRCPRCGSATDSPGLSRSGSSRPHQHIGETQMSFSLQLRGLSADVESSRERSSSTIGRRHPPPRLPSRDSGALGPRQPLARGCRSVSEQYLRTCFPERVQKEAELAAFLAEAGHPPRGEMEELRKLEVDLDVMKFELVSLKQRMESSFAVLEQEKTWVEMLSSGDRKRKWRRKEKVFPLTLELLKAKSYAGRRRNGLLAQVTRQNEDGGKTDVSQDTLALQENQVVQEDGVQAFEGEQAAHLWKAVREMPGTEPGTLCVPSRGSSAEPQPSETVPLNPEHAQKKREGSNDQPVVLHAGLVGAESQDSLGDPEKVLLKHKLDSPGQANGELSSRVAVSPQTLEASSDRLCHSESEKKMTPSQALETERAELLGEREGGILEGQPARPSWEEELHALQVTCENLRGSQALLQREKDLSETRCLELEAALRSQREEMERHLAEQKQGSQYWQDRWEKAATALKTKKEELEEAHLQSQTSSAQPETPLLLQIQLDACKQELEQNRSQAPQCYVQRRESGSQTDAVSTSETARQEVDAETALVREELQKALDILKSRDSELEGKQLDLETAREQNADCRSEKERLDKLVSSLEEQLAEKERALRQLKEAGEEDRAEKETKILLLEQKLAEMEAAQDLPRHGSNTTPVTPELQENVPGEDSGAQGPCRCCGTALAQLNQAIQSAEKREKEDRTLACLYQLRDLLKGIPSDRALVPKPVQSPSRNPASKVTQSPLEEREILRHRHQLVTEQLQGLFRQRQQLEQSKKPPGGAKEERWREPRKSPQVLAAPESNRPPEEPPAAPDVPSPSADVQRLQQLLREKTETISSMASEIHALQQKNESLMKAKLRFQQQIQQIRNLPKQRPERSTLELLVPRLSVTLGQDSHSGQGSDSSVPSPQSDEPPFTGSREDLSQALGGSQPHASAEEQQRGASPDEDLGQVPRAPPSPPIPAGSSRKHLSLELIPSLPADSEGALASPRGSALLSPRPFGPPRPWSPFKFRGNSELPESGEKH